MAWLDFFLSHARPFSPRENSATLENGMNRGDTAMYIGSMTRNVQNNTTAVEKLKTSRRDSNKSSIFTRAKQRFSTNDEEPSKKRKSRLRAIAWTAVIGVILLVVGFMLFVVGASLGRRYTEKINSAIDTEFAYQNTQLILYVISVCFSTMFAALAIASVHILFLQEKKLDVYRYGARKMAKTGKGSLWSSKRMKVFITVMNILFIVSACYFVIQIVATWSLVLWYRDLNSMSEPALSLDEDIQLILESSGVTNVTEQTVEEYLTTLTEDFQRVLNESSFDNIITNEIVCPGLYCVNLESVSFITSDECICNETTIDVINHWSAVASLYYIISLTGACSLFLSILILGMRCMLAGSKVKVRLSHWEFVAPMLVAQDHGSSPSGNSSWDGSSDQIRIRTDSNKPKHPLYMGTPMGILGTGGDAEEMGESAPIDIDTYFPTVDLEYVEQGMSHSDISFGSHASTRKAPMVKNDENQIGVLSRERTVQFESGSTGGLAAHSNSRKILNNIIQTGAVGQSISGSMAQSSYSATNKKEYGDSSNVTKDLPSIQDIASMSKEDPKDMARPKVLFAAQPDLRDKKSRVVHAYESNRQREAERYYMDTSAEEVHSSAESSSKRSSHHTSDSGHLTDNGDINPFLYRC